jgi:hypothetical protein
VRDRALRDKLIEGRLTFRRAVTECLRLGKEAGADPFGAALAQHDANTYRKTADIFSHLIEFAEREVSCQLCEEKTAHDAPDLCVQCAMTLHLEAREEPRQ